MTPTTNHRLDADSPPGTQNVSAAGVTETPRDGAEQLKETSVEAARQVAGTAKEKATDVTSDVRRQAQQFAGQTRDQIVEQASRQKDRAADSLRSISEELRGMAEHGQSGSVSRLARHGADFTDQAADFLQERQPGELLDEVRTFARRKPGTFLLTAVAAGVVAGRLTRALAAGTTGTPSSTTGGRSTEGGPTASPPPVPTPVAPDPDPGAPVAPRFGPESEG
jgi:uncharacterized protein YjbJ (UPF0337 family)